MYSIMCDTPKAGAEIWKSQARRGFLGGHGFPEPAWSSPAGLEFPGMPGVPGRGGRHAWG